MKILAVETATRCHSVAIVDDQHVLAEETHPDCASHASVLIPSIDRLLDSLTISLEQLDGLAVSIGPGSFTGLRVGISTMLGFRVSTQLPLVTVSTLEAMAWNVKNQDGVVCPILNASRTEIYWGVFEWKSGQVVRRSPDRYGTITQLVESIGEKTIFCGEGWIRHEAKIKEWLGEKGISGPQEAMGTSATSVALSSLSSFRAKQYAGRQLSPWYIQRAEAEVQWEAKAGKSSV